MNCSAFWTGYVTAIVLPIIALMGAWIAFRQSEIARNKIKLDLFDKRYVIFTHTWTHLSNIVRNGAQLNDERSAPYDIAKNFRNNIAQAGFLFGPDIENHLNQIDKNHVELWELELKTDTEGLTEEEKDRCAAMITWFVNEARDAKKRFHRYLSFNKWG